MKEDVWLHPSQARLEMLKTNNAVVKTETRRNMVVGIDEAGSVVETRRIFDGTEHPLAQRGKVLSRVEHSLTNQLTANGCI